MDPYLEVILFLAWIGAIAFALYLVLEKSLVWGLIVLGGLLVFPLGEMNKREKEAKAMQPQTVRTCTCTCTPSGQESSPP